MKIEITGTPQTRSGRSQAGRDYSITTQQAYLHNGEPYPTQMKIQVENEMNAYAKGMYQVPFTSENFYVDKYGSLTVARNLKLNPVHSSEKPKVVNS